jgi:hypothetical protein
MVAPCSPWAFSLPKANSNEFCAAALQVSVVSEGYRQCPYV